jgi:streptogramin lyase
MRALALKLVSLAAVCAASLALAAPALAAPAVTGTFPLGNEVEANQKIVAGPDGNMWFTLASGKDVGKITPTGQVMEYDLEGVEGATGIAPGPEGKMWVPSTNKITSFSPSDPEGTDHTFTTATINAGGQIVTAPNGLMWVASNNALMHFSPADPEGTATPVPTLEPEISPFDIDVAGPLIVIADNGGGNSRVDTFTTAGLEKDYPVGGMTQGVAGAPTGQIAYTAPGATPEEVGLIQPPTASPAFDLVGDPFGVAYGSDQAFWIVQFAAGGLERVTAAGVRTFLPGLPKESARQIGAGPNNTLWVTLTHKEGVVEKSEIARISGLEPPATTLPPPPVVAPIPILAPQTTLGKTPRTVVKTTAAKASVKFGFSSATAGAGFECSLAHKVKPKGKGKGKGKKPRFVGTGFGGCSSPQAYRLKPGRYRFEVRAVVGAVRDSSPATFGFSVVRVAKR